MRSFTPYLLFVLFIVSCTAQKKTSKDDITTINHLKSHITFLADDRLEGRRAGSPGEKLAMDYIADQFAGIGVTAKGSSGYFQAFAINEGKEVRPATELMINGTRLALTTDYFPFPYSSPKAKLQATQAIALHEAGEPWFFDLKETLEENKNNPHFDLEDYVYKNAQKVRERGATALFLYNSTAIDDRLVFNPKHKADTLSIPVFYFTKKAVDTYMKDPTASLTIELATDIADKKRDGHNVVGYIDNGASSTVAIGAHFDHLGFGEDGNSMIRTGEKMIHNGADDNASGTAALIELARKLKNSAAKSKNYLFIGFSGEELGLYGSKYYVDNPTVDLTQVDYMINMDMVGRLNDSSRVITIGGVGTSPVWGEIFDLKVTPGVNITSGSFVYKFDSSGAGPSDHTSFYRKDIPVLFYFTGLHTDYHKPSDDADKINYKGTAMIVDHVQSVIERLDKRGKPAFTKTRETQMNTNASFKVTMGIMPDYTFSGTGVRADGVTDGRPAKKAGLQTGDIILQLGEHSTSTMEGYMQALGKFKKGEKTKVKYKRGNEVLEATVEF